MYALQEMKISHPEIVLAQSKLETGYYTSQLTRTHNNIFGFRTKNGYLQFDHWKECIQYYKKWQSKRYKGSGDYYKFLQEIGYAEDTNYIHKLKKIVNEPS